ncbi:MAG: chorismate synthase [Ruminococcus sp.]|nr:chorismate synthase [Ruminococcus sp.]
MSSTWGEKVKISVFGESHGNGIGVVIDGLPAGFKVDNDKLFAQMARRAPGKDKTATPRKESDLPNVLSGMLNNITTGAPLCAIINNTNTKSGDYSNLLACPRPGHSDYTAYEKYNSFNDIRGGGHFSGRLTAPLVFAGSICRQILEEKGIKISAHISQIGNVKDDPFNPVNIDNDLMGRLSQSSFSLIDTSKEEAMREVVENARLNQDSVGGIIECAVTGLPTGLGGPMFGGVEGLISSIIFGIPAIKGIEFGKGFKLAEMLGSESNDPFEYKDGKVVTKTNNCGGILGGITNSMPVIFRACIKPTPSISKEQDTVDLQKKCNTKLSINGRHDPCIVPRAVSVIEACTAIALMNLV